MGALSLNLPVIGQPNSTEDQKIRDALLAIQTDYNGNVNATNIAANGVNKDALDSSTVASLIGLSQTGTVRRGKFIQATSGSRTNTAYGALSNGPDQVSSVVVPTDGLVLVSYYALWQESVNGAGRAALFIGANQLQVHLDNSP